MSVIAEIKSTDGTVLTTVALPPKEFKTGSRGMFAMGKLEIEGKRYQFQIQLVEIGSKKASTDKE